MAKVTQHYGIGEMKAFFDVGPYSHPIETEIGRLRFKVLGLKFKVVDI
jgi:hypothetical protein